MSHPQAPKATMPIAAREALSVIVRVPLAAIYCARLAPDFCRSQQGGGRTLDRLIQFFRDEVDRLNALDKYIGWRFEVPCYGGNDPDAIRLWGCHETILRLEIIRDASVPDEEVWAWIDLELENV